MSTAENLPSLDELDVIGPESYMRNGYPHAAWKRLREESPIHWFDVPGGVGFWAVTRREDIVWLSKQPDRFINAPRLAIFEEGAPVEGGRTFVRQLLNMDPPGHTEYRGTASAWFTPRSIKRRSGEVRRIARELLDEMAGDGEVREGDFVRDLAVPLTLGVLADMLGVPRADWPKMFEWTNRVAGSSDPEFQDGVEEGESPFVSIEQTRNELFGYFAELAAERRKEPRDDIVSVLANSTIGGAPMPPLELLSYYFLLVIAGNETTRNSASGGLLALIENPDEFAKLKANPRLVNPAVEEIVRWTSPIIHFARTASRDYTLRDKVIREGQSVALFYASANRDEEVFEKPFEFLVDRKPNRHIGFGVGEHFCLGAHLARLEMQVAYRHLLPRIEEIELVGPVDRLHSALVGGVKRLPIHYKLRPAK